MLKWVIQPRGILKKIKSQGSSGSSIKDRRIQLYRIGRAGCFGHSGDRASCTLRFETRFECLHESYFKNFCARIPYRPIRIRAVSEVPGVLSVHVQSSVLSRLVARTGRTEENRTQNA